MLEKFSVNSVIWHMPNKNRESQMKFHKDSNNVFDPYGRVGKYTKGMMNTMGPTIENDHNSDLYCWQIL